MNKQESLRNSRKHDVSGNPLLDHWIKTAESLGESGGFVAQAEGHRVQFRKQWVQSLAPFAGQQWWAWVPGELCCRLAPNCAKGLFYNDVRRWNSFPGHDQIAMPSGDVPLKCKYEPRGRMTIPETIAAAAGLIPSRMLHVVARRSFIEIWIPDVFTAYCARIAQPIPSITGSHPVTPI